MRPELKIRRHGYHLMSLASLGMGMAAVLGVGASLLAWSVQASPSLLSLELFGAPLDELAGMEREARLLLALSGLVLTAAWLVPLFALRRVGKALYRYEALSLQVASAFMLLAHSLPAWLLLSLGHWVLASLAYSTGAGREVSFTVSSSSYLFILACLCLYSVAHVMRLAAAAADDARSIV